MLLVEPSWEIVSGYGSFNLRGELADRTAKVMSLLMPLSALIGAGIAARGFWRWRFALPSADSGSRLNGIVVASSLLIWVAFIAFNNPRLGRSNADS